MEDDKIEVSCGQRWCSIIQEALYGQRSRRESQDENLASDGEEEWGGLRLLGKLSVFSI